MRALILITSFSLGIGTAAAAEPEIKGTPTELRGYLQGLASTIAITGEGEMKVQADQAVMTFKIVTEQKSLADALKQNEDIRSQIATYLRSRGLSADRIQKTKFSSAARHGVFTDKVKSQRVENQIKIATRDEKEFQAVAALPDRFPEVSYAGTEFEHSEKERFRNLAVAQACANAETRKQQYEQALNLKLTPKSFKEQFLQQAPATGRIGDHSSSASTYAAEPKASSAYPSYGPLGETVSAFGELQFKVQVTVEYSADKTVKP